MLPDLRSRLCPKLKPLILFFLSITLGNKNKLNKKKSQNRNLEAFVKV